MSKAMVCDHELYEQESACADGRCPICMGGIIERLDTALQASESIKAGYLRELTAANAMRAALEKIADPSISWGHMKLIAREALGLSEQRGSAHGQD